VVGVVTVLLAVTRRVRSEAPEDTGAAYATGVIGVAQPGMLQAEVYAEEELGEDRAKEEASSGK